MAAPPIFPWLNTERGFPLGKAEGYAGGAENMALGISGLACRPSQFLIEQLMGCECDHLV